jgi:GNAT superfamily N-acetyltransferase
MNTSTMNPLKLKKRHGLLQSRLVVFATEIDMDIQFTTFTESYEEALPLIRAHWDEVPFGPWHDVGVNVNTPIYLLMEQQGYLRVMTARDNGKLIGYIVMMCAERTHHKGMWHVVSDVVYVDPAYRGKKVFERMVDAMKKDSKKAGISFFTIGVNPNFDFSHLVERMGAELTEKSYTWRL